MIERITDPDSGNSIGHVFRYELVRGFLYSGDSVLDAACGIGYGERVLRSGLLFNRYYGVDIFKPDNLEFLDKNHSFFVHEDLSTFDPGFEYDIAIGYETLEHLEDYENYIKVLKRAYRMIFMSVPIVPSKHINHFHVHDFTFEDVPELICDDNWQLHQALQQPSEVSGIYIFTRKDNWS